MFLQISIIILINFNVKLESAKTSIYRIYIYKKFFVLCLIKSIFFFTILCFTEHSSVIY